ncbi:endonuclease III domain-containing protein [Tichowtungia aerotolerans]|uniref:HhH-GPD domain-containing protein n=1 Tax=Tichowtungia aerotolerans TaxID=2697043 RepID=A0A6P1M5U8_9BACT|nr:hypothetical protein [Tichowtungia aerotolerans]QHI69211.1 hypothetical protein GT409_07015 [Tichowtungia aerotolerans]
MTALNKQPLSIPKIYDSLFAAHGPQNWWPARTRAEMMIGAVLTQNTAWTNVEKASSNLRKNSALNFQTLQKKSVKQIAEWIRPAGYFNQKAACLKALSGMIAEYGSVDRLFKLNTPDLRNQLLGVKGIGPETADCMLLYAAKRPVFVVDAYTRRLLAHYGYKKESESSYHNIATFFTDALPVEVQLFNEYHALIVRWGKDNSRKKAA